MVWPGQAGRLHELVDLGSTSGARRFVLNMPWQSVLFESHSRLTLWAGPFCNIANGFAVASLKRLGFSGAIVSPELGKKDYLALPGQSILPLGIVLSANWPLCISRTLAEQFKEGTPFTSPKGETAWAAKYGRGFLAVSQLDSGFPEQKGIAGRRGLHCFCAPVGTGSENGQHQDSGPDSGTGMWGLSRVCWVY